MCLKDSAHSIRKCGYLYWNFHCYFLLVSYSVHNRFVSFFSIFTNSTSDWNELPEEISDLVPTCAAEWFLVLEIQSGIPTNEKKDRKLKLKRFHLWTPFSPIYHCFWNLVCFWQTLHWNIYKWQVWETCFLQYLCKIIIKPWWREIKISWSQVSIQACYCISKYDRNDIHFPNTVKKEFQIFLKSLNVKELTTSPKSSSTELLTAFIAALYSSILGVCNVLCRRWKRETDKS